MKKSFVSVVVVALILTGCGNGTNTENKDTGGASNSSSNSEIVTPMGYENAVINNKGEAVQSKLGKFSIRLYSNAQDKPDAQSVHKGVVVNVNGQDSQTMPIQASYIGDKIKVVVYDENNNMLITSDAIQVVDDVPVVLANVTL